MVQDLGILDHLADDALKVETQEGILFRDLAHEFDGPLDLEKVVAAGTGLLELVGQGLVAAAAHDGERALQAFAEASGDAGGEPFVLKQAFLDVGAQAVPFAAAEQAQAGDGELGLVFRRQAELDERLLDEGFKGLPVEAGQGVAPGLEDVEITDVVEIDLPVGAPAAQDVAKVLELGEAVHPLPVRLSRNVRGGAVRRPPAGDPWPNVAVACRSAVWMHGTHSAVCRKAFGAPSPPSRARRLPIRKGPACTVLGSG